jgi:hypothetical protein
MPNGQTQRKCNANATSNATLYEVEKMNIRNEKPNLIIISLNSDCSRVESIDIQTKAFRFVDTAMALMQRCFRINTWGSLRYLCLFDGRPVVADRKAGEI